MLGGEHCRPAARTASGLVSHFRAPPPRCLSVPGHRPAVFGGTNFWQVDARGTSTVTRRQVGGNGGLHLAESRIYINSNSCEPFHLKKL